MATWQNIAGVWKSGSWWQNVGGVWKRGNVWQNVAGVWKNLSVMFSPVDGGYVSADGQYSAGLSLGCNVPAVWTYTTASGFGGTVNTPSGSTSTSIVFSISASGGSIGNRQSREQTWNVTGTANGVSRDFTVYLLAQGDRPID